ncbi:hypothetical protein BBJ28_00007602 [Nothophytophthora sp. Chile5]|nr:hypothetical protein BBJ28_00007602 [Nothophytophthora sp. Chile5]
MTMAGSTGDGGQAPETPQLYKTSKMRRPELWQFIRLVVPDPPQVSAGRTYTNQDAKEAYCLKCKRMMHYNTGSSNNVSRHMAKFHAAELASYAQKVAERKTKSKKQQTGSGNAGGSRGRASASGNVATPRSNSSTAATTTSPNGSHKRKRSILADGTTSTGMGTPAASNGLQLPVARSQGDLSASDTLQKRARDSQTFGVGAGGTTIHDQQQAAGPTEGLTLAEIEQLNALVARWVCKHYHPFSITGDPELQELLQFAATLRKPVVLPTPSAVRASVESLSARTRLDLMHQLSSEVLFFSMATEVWTTAERDVFVSFSIHYLTTTFERRHFTLDVREHSSQQLSHDAKKEVLDALLARWNLDTRFLSLMLWQSQLHTDVDANSLAMLQPHTQQAESAAHGFEIILAPLLHGRKELDEGGMQVFFFDEVVNNAVASVPFEYQNGVQFVRDQVSFFRGLAFFLTNHPRAVMRLGKLMAGTSPLRLVTDSKSSWLSTLDMLKRLVKKRDVIRDFFAYLETSEGRVEFQNASSSMPPSGTGGGVHQRAPTSEQWCAIECLLQLLQPFENVALAIGKEKFAASSLTFPLLRFLKRDLEKVADFQRVFARYCGSPSSAGVTEYDRRRQVSDDELLASRHQIASQLETARKFLYVQFMLHFSRACDELMWISQLDPRFVRMKYLTEDEREVCKTRLIDQCFMLSNFLQQMANQRYKMPAASAAGANVATTGGGSGGMDAPDANGSFLDFQSTRDDHDTNSFLQELLFNDAHEDPALAYQQQQQQHLLQQQQKQMHLGATASPTIVGGGTVTSSSDAAAGAYVEPESTLRMRVMDEVKLYYDAVASAKVGAMRDPLKWWRDNTPTFPLLVPLARQWLGSVGSVRPSEVVQIGSTTHSGLAVSYSGPRVQAGAGGGGAMARGSHAVHSEPELVRDLMFVHDNC